MWQKLSGGGQLPAKSKLTELAKGLLGGTLAIFILCILTEISGYPLLMAPFGASCVLLFAASGSPLAQPRNVIFGHLLSSLIELIFLQFIGDGIVSISFAVGCAIAAMQFLRVVHPPAGADPLVVILAGKVSYVFLLFPVFLGAVILVLIALFINNLGAEKRYPLYWRG